MFKDVEAGVWLQFNEPNKIVLAAAYGIWAHLATVKDRRPHIPQVGARAY
jgi:hypothetical protein